MIFNYQHRVGEKFKLITDFPPSTKYRVFRSNDGKYFNKIANRFETYNPANAPQYLFTLYPKENQPELSETDVDYLPETIGDYIFEFYNLDMDAIIRRERHVYGGFQDIEKNGLCYIYGQLLSATGKPLAGVIVQILTNKSGFFTEKYPLTGEEITLVTDECGYFEKGILQGLTVTVSIPQLGYSKTGVVPPKDTLEFNSSDFWK